MLRWVRGLIDKVVAVAFALLFSQIPFFMQQYQGQLQGRVLELQLQLDSIRKAAAITGKTLPQYIAKFLNSGDIDFVSQGKLMEGMVNRYQYLNQSYQNILHANVYSKPYEFMKTFDWDIGHATWGSFIPGFEFSTTSLIYAAIGLLVSMLIFHLFGSLFALIFTPFKKKA